jgi:hypothetical protein
MEIFYYTSVHKNVWPRFAVSQLPSSSYSAGNTVTLKAVIFGEPSRVRLKIFNYRTLGKPQLHIYH